LESRYCGRPYKRELQLSNFDVMKACTTVLVLSNFGNVPDVIMSRLANSFYMFFKVKALIENDTKITS